MGSPNSTYTELNPGIGGDVMDETLVAGYPAPSNRKRPRVVMTGEGIDDIVSAKSDNVSGDEIGLVVRPVISNYPGNLTNSFSDASGVPTNSETTVVTYTVPASTSFYFIGLVTSGNANALFRLKVNGSTVLAGRTTVSNLSWSLSYSYSPIVALDSDVVTITVIHQAGVACDFEATIMGYEL
jgi:hypothetical protein